MAYVVVRPRGRFEIRESIHTPKGSRARSLANFERLTDAVLDAARRRASRPFDPDAVRLSALKAEKAAARRRLAGGPLGGVATPGLLDRRQFVEASRRMAQSLELVPSPEARRDPGDALMDLLGLVAQVSAFTDSRAPEPLRFPPLGHLWAARGGVPG